MTVRWRPASPRCWRCCAGGRRSADWVKQPVGLDLRQAFGQGQVLLQRPPLPGMPMPVEVEAVRPAVGHTGKGCVEFLDRAVLAAGLPALEEAVGAAVPGAIQPDGMV